MTMTACTTFYVTDGSVWRTTAVWEESGPSDPSPPHGIVEVDKADHAPPTVAGVVSLLPVYHPPDCPSCGGTCEAYLLNIGFHRGMPVYGKEVCWRFWVERWVGASHKYWPMGVLLNRSIDDIVVPVELTAFYRGNGTIRNGSVLSQILDGISVDDPSYPHAMLDALAEGDDPVSFVKLRNVSKTGERVFHDVIGAVCRGEGVRRAGTNWVERDGDGKIHYPCDQIRGSGNVYGSSVRGWMRRHGASRLS